MDPLFLSDRKQKNEYIPVPSPVYLPDTLCTHDKFRYASMVQVSVCLPNAYMSGFYLYIQDQTMPPYARQRPCQI